VKGKSMLKYALPALKEIAPVAADEVLLIANGDLRQSALFLCRRRVPSSSSSWLICSLNGG
jgi:hypothetical protein